MYYLDDLQTVICPRCVKVVVSRIAVRKAAHGKVGIGAGRLSACRLSISRTCEQSCSMGVNRGIGSTKNVPGTCSTRYLV